MLDKEFIKENDDKGFNTLYPGFDPLIMPEPLYRVTGGPGGEAILILGSEKTGLWDCGLACFSDQLIRNIHDIIDEKGRTLDYVFLSHTHFDHMGALPYLIKEWPELKVIAAKKAIQVFKSDIAKDTMINLGKVAAEENGRDIEIICDPLRVDIVVDEEDEVSLGEEKMISYITKGHTDCSVSYLLEPQGYLIISESQGCPVGPKICVPAPLKGYEDSIRSTEKLKKLSFNRVIATHFGAVPEGYTHQILDDYIQMAKDEKEFLLDLINKGFTNDEIVKEHSDIFYTERRSKQNSFDAYSLNLTIVINGLRRALSENREF